MDKNVTFAAGTSQEAVEITANVDNVYGSAVFIQNAFTITDFSTGTTSNTGSILINEGTCKFAFKSAI